MKIKIIATGSSGNAILLENGDSRLLLDAGIAGPKLSIALNHELHKLDGCLITHEHGDHIKGVKCLIKNAVDCYMSYGTAEALEIQSHRIKKCKAKKILQIGKWKVMPFDVVHDVKEPFGYLMVIENEKILYATDTAFIDPIFKGITRMIIECNWMPEYINECFYRSRLMTTHLSLPMVEDFIKSSDKTKLKEIVLMHQSHENMDNKEAISRIKNIVGNQVIVR